MKLSSGYKGRDTITSLPRAKMVVFEWPQTNWGVGLSIQLRLNSQGEKQRYFWFFEIGGGYASSLNAPTKVHWEYFNYLKTEESRHVNGINLDEYRNIQWLNKPQVALESLDFQSPKITDWNLLYSWQIAFRPLLKKSFKIGFTFTKTYHSFYQSKHLLLQSRSTNLSFCLSSGFGIKQNP